MKFLVLVKVRRDARITPELAEAHKRVMLEQMEKGLAESVYNLCRTSSAGRNADSER
jgi:hypothetical protein